MTTEPTEIKADAAPSPSNPGYFRATVPFVVPDVADGQAPPEYPTRHPLLPEGVASYLVVEILEREDDADLAIVDYTFTPIAL